MTATYWEIGRRIVEFEQKGRGKADYGDVLMKRLGPDLTARFGRGFGWRNLYQMRAFYLAYSGILQTPSAIFGSSNPVKKIQTLSGKCDEISQTLSAEFKEITSPESTAIIQTPSGLFDGVRQTKKSQTLSGESRAKILQTPSAKLSLGDIAKCFPLPW